MMPRVLALRKACWERRVTGTPPRRRHGWRLLRVAQPGSEVGRPPPPPCVTVMETVRSVRRWPITRSIPSPLTAGRSILLTHRSVGDRETVSGVHKKPRLGRYAIDGRRHQHLLPRMRSARSPCAMKSG